MTKATLDILRRCFFRLKDGPTFSLITWDLRGERIGYRLRMNGRTLFEGTDFGPSPLDCIDSDATIASLMTFLTLKPGDVDEEYFEGYTPEQVEFCSTHAEALIREVDRRFGEED